MNFYSNNSAKQITTLPHPKPTPPGPAVKCEQRSCERLGCPQIPAVLSWERGFIPSHGTNKQIRSDEIDCNDMPTVTHAMQISKHTVQTNHREAEEGRETEADVCTGTTHRKKRLYVILFSTQQGNTGKLTGFYCYRYHYRFRLSIRFFIDCLIDSCGSSMRKKSRPIQISSVNNPNFIICCWTMTTTFKHRAGVQPLQERGLCASLMTVFDRHCSIAGYVSEQESVWEEGRL